MHSLNNNVFGKELNLFVNGQNNYESLTPNEYINISIINIRYCNV